MSICDGEDERVSKTPFPKRSHHIDGGMKMFRRVHGNAKSERLYIIHLTCLAESDIRNVLLMTCNVGRGEAESDIIRHQQDISNVGRRWGMLNVLSSPQI